MRCLLVLISVFFSCNYFSQNDSIKVKKKHQWYASWGYTKCWYSKSTIEFKDLSGKYHPATDKYNYYDFKVHNVTASDRTDFDKIKDVINFTIPQFVARVGFKINEKWDVELNYDHAKYLVDDGQRTRVTGQIFGSAIDKDTTMGGQFLHFEHTDGANFLMANAVRKFNLMKRGSLFKLQWVLKPGIGLVYPRTDVTIFGERLNNNWHVAGWIVGVESGLRMEFLKHGFLELVGKGAYADYVKSLVLGKGNGSARHHFFATQVTFALGYKFHA
jgi:hypothetical protein